MLVTSFWHADGPPMSSQAFIKLLDGRFQRVDKTAG
jgi:hypothetical protein